MTYTPKAYSKEFLAWLEAGRVTRFDWELTVAGVGAERAIELVENRIASNVCGDWPAPCNCIDPTTHDRSLD